MDERWKLTEKLRKSNWNRWKLSEDLAHGKLKFDQFFRCVRVRAVWERREDFLVQLVKKENVVFISQQEKQQMKKASFNFLQTWIDSLGCEAGRRARVVSHWPNYSAKKIYCNFHQFFP